MTVVIVCLLTETLAESRDRERSKKSQLTSQRLNRYLQPPPFQSDNAQQPTQVTKLRSVSSSSSPAQNEQGRSNTGDLYSRGHRNSRWFYETGESPRPTKLARENKQHGISSVHSPSISQPHSVKSPQQSVSSSHRYRSILPYRGGPQKTSLQGVIHGKQKGDCNPCNKVPWIPMSHTSSGISDHFLALGTPHGGPSSHYRDLPLPNLPLQSAQYGPPPSTVGAPLDLDSSFSNSEEKGQSPPFKQLPIIGLQSDYGLHPKPPSSSLPTVQHAPGGEHIYKHSQLNYGLPPPPPSPGHPHTSFVQNLPISINHEPNLSEPPKQSNKHYRPTPQSLPLKGLKLESYPPTSRFPQLSHIPTASYGIPVAPSFPSKHLAGNYRPPKQQRPIIFHSKSPDYLPPPSPPVIPALDDYKLPDSLPSGTDFRPPQSPHLASSESNHGSPPSSLSDNLYSHQHLSNEFGLPPPTQNAYANDVTSRPPDYNQYSTIIATPILSPSYAPVHPVHDAQVISHDSSVSNNHEQTKNYHHQQQDSSLQQYLVPPLSSEENVVVNNQHQQSNSHFQLGGLHDDKNNIAGVDLRGFTGGVNFDVVQSVPLVETSFTSSDEQHSGEHFNGQSSQDGIHVIPAESEEETKHKTEGDSPYSTDQLIQSSATFQNTYLPEAPALYLNPPRKEHEVFNHVTNSPAIDYTSWNPASGSSPIPPIDIAESIPSWNEATTPLPLQHSVNDNHAIDSIENVGLVPPPPPFNQQLSQSPKKKTKQIQIIVPYTSNREAMHFQQTHQTRPLNIETSGWSPMTGIISDTYLNHEWKVPHQGNCSDLSLENIKRATMCNASFSLDQWLQQQEDYHQHQESRTVTATASVTQNPFQVTNAIDTKQTFPGYNIRKPSGEIQHILTSNIRDILRGEEYGKNTVDYITLLRLQKNINDWTAQEYSSSTNSSSNETSGNENKSTTPAFNILSHHLLVPSKNIPEEYLTTSPSVFDDFTQSENSVATSVPKYPIRNNLSMQTTPVFYDHEASGSFLHPVNKSSNQVVFQINNIEDTLNREKQTNTNKIDVTRPSPVWNDHQANDISTVTDTISTTTLPPTTTEVSTDTTTFETTIDGDLTSLPSWDELEVSISPITKEKVYVVTPLTTWTSDPTTSIPPRNHRLRGTLTNTPRTRTSSTSIHDVFPFRNGPKPSSGTKEDSEESFHSPRFAVRPTPSPTMQRSFTVTSADDDDANFSKGTAPYPVEDNEISYTYSKGLFGSGVTSAANSSREKSTAETLLWGLTDLPTYTPPAGTRVRTYSGHSRVVTAPTIASSRKKLQGLDTKTSTTPSTTSSRPRPVGILRKYRPDRHSYLWHFPELLTPVGDTLKDEEEEAVKSAVVELKKERRS
uniref:Uncharacterized protein n=1 Tax=Timema bartmani TaxID=61472 RepID=A0A7R9F013_9NEOP|nr:unnamed protein product [Timema bartmani]